uniref:Thioredoxin domain-containing protein n=1 Tax=Meloidogyne hapla TaxID=6305 RepID=A0A1I8BPQ9_MELHA
MLNIRFSNFVKRTVSSFTALFGQPAKMPLLMDKNYLFVQSVNFGSFKRFEILPLRSFSVQSGELPTFFEVDADDFNVMINLGMPVIFCFYDDSLDSRHFVSSLEAKMEEKESKILLAKVKKVEGKYGSLIQNFQVKTFPTTISFRDGKLLERHDGIEEIWEINYRFAYHLETLLDNLLLPKEEKKRKKRRGRNKY